MINNSMSSVEKIDIIKNTHDYSRITTSFHNFETNVLVSGALDGTLCIYDIQNNVSN